MIFPTRNSRNSRSFQLHACSTLTVSNRFENFTKDSGRAADSDGTYFQGTTTWNAVQILQTENGMKLKMNNPYFTTTNIDTNGTISTEIVSDQNQRWLEWLSARDCRKKYTKSYGSLKGTMLKFDPSIFPVSSQGSGHSGQYTRSQNDKVITVGAKGSCASTYYGTLIWKDDVHPEYSHDIPVIFEKTPANLGETQNTCPVESERAKG